MGKRPTSKESPVPEILKYFLKKDDITKRYNIYRIINNEKFWKDLGTPKGPKKHPSEQSPRKPKGREEALKYLDEIFIGDDLKDEIVIRTAIPDVLEGKEASYNGVILYGPPGTGKTVLLRALCDVYQASGAYAQEISVNAMNSCYVGEFAKNLENEIEQALREAKERKKPALLCFDEGSVLAQIAGEGAASVAKHYQEVIDTLKRYIGNEKYLVIAISTNMLPESFEEALTREGRLKSFFIGYPDKEQRKRMWKHFAGKYGVIELNNKQTEKLADITPKEQGAFIEEYARNYKIELRREILRAKGYKTLIDALKQGANVTEVEVSKSITFDKLYSDIMKRVEEKYGRIEDNGEKRVAIGFNGGKK